MYILAEKGLKQALVGAGYASMDAFVQATGYSRDTLSSYLKGQPVFQEKFRELAKLLKINPLDIIQFANEPFDYQGTMLEPVVETLMTINTKICVVLFGSRARPKQNKNADWDLGIYATKKISGHQFLKLYSAISETIDNLPHKVDIVNLTNCDEDFLLNIKNDVRFVCGRWLAYRKLLLQIDLYQSES